MSKKAKKLIADSPRFMLGYWTQAF